MELNNLGWNALTISFFGTILFTLIEAWGVWDQKREIWQKKSGVSIPINLFIFNLFIFAVIFIYGISINSVALMFSGIVMAPIHVPILVGLYKFKGFNNQEKIFFWTMLFIFLLCVLLPYKTFFFFSLSLIYIGVAILQPHEIWKEKSSGVVSIKMLWSYWVGTTFWVTYGFSFNDLPLKITSSLYLLVATITIILWYKYRNKTQHL